MAQPDFAVAWLRQRTLGAQAVAAVEAAELHNLTAEQALADADALLSVGFDDDRRETSGFVEQQRLFSRARR